MDKRYQVFVSSTYVDLKEERKAIIESLLNAKYIPAGMEMFSASNDEQFKYIKKIIDSCDYYVLIIGGRYGTINPSTGISFTEQEYDYAISKKIPVLVFLHEDPYNLPHEKRDDENKALLKSFRDKASMNRLCRMWKSPSELMANVIISLGEEVYENPQLGWMRGSMYDSAELLSQINDLRINIDTVNEENERLKIYIEQSYVKIENLACGDDKYIIVGKDHSNNYIEEQLTWDEIFSAIGPYLFSYINFDTFSIKLYDAIKSVSYNNFYTINNDCKQTIKIQLQALGLIEIKSKESVSNGVLEFISITERGKQYLMEIKSIKKK